MTDRVEERVERWTIYVCSKCGRRQAARYFCRCEIPSERCQSVEVVRLSRALQAEQEAERLREALKLIADGAWNTGMGHVRDFARNALAHDPEERRND